MSQIEQLSSCPEITSILTHDAVRAPLSIAEVERIAKEFNEDQLSEYLECLQTVNTVEALVREYPDELTVDEKCPVNLISIQKTFYDRSRRVPMDLISALIPCNFSFLLELLFTKGMMEWWFNQCGLRNLDTDFDGPFVEPNTSFRLVYVGSFSDGINVPNYSYRPHMQKVVIPSLIELVAQMTPYDLDILLLLNMPPVSSQFMDTTSTYPGYCSMTAPTGEKCMHEDILGQFGSDLIRSGPALTKYVDGETGISEDYVPTLPCAFWPDQAVPWISRNRLSKWPSQQMILTIVLRRCHLVAKAHPMSKHPENEWRYSFVRAEKMLIQDLSVVQKQAYVTLKMLIKALLFPGMAFSSYCLKTALFWTMEKIPEATWTDYRYGLGYGFLAILDTLIYFLAEHNVPMYFIPENNIIDHVPRPDVRRNLKALIEFRQKPQLHLLDFDLKNNIIPSLRMPLLCVLSRRFTQYIIAFNLRFRECVKLHQLELCNAYIPHLLCRDALQEVLYAIRHLRYLLFQSSLRHVSGVSCLRSFFDFFIQNTDRVPMIDTLLNCLAAAISVIYYQEDKNKEEDADFVEIVFEVALSYQNHPIETDAYYAMFLCQRGKEEKALRILDSARDSIRNIFETNDRTTCPYLTVIPEERLDSTLQYVLPHIQHQLPTYIFLSYLRIPLLHKQNRHQSSVALQKLEADCELLWQAGNPKDLYSNCFILLAIAYVEMGDQQHALELLQEKEDIFRNHSSAEKIINKYMGYKVKVLKEDSI